MTHQTPQIEAYHAGFAAFVDGSKVSKNPYLRNTELYFCWNRGWSTANYGSKVSAQ